MAHPPPDDEIRDYLCEIQEEVLLRFRYLSFFLALCRRVNAEIELLAEGRKVSQQAFANLWRDHLEELGNRGSFYKAVCDDATNLRVSFSKESVHCTLLNIHGI